MTQAVHADTRDETYGPPGFGAWAGLAFVLILGAFLVMVLSEAPTGQADLAVVRQWFAEDGDLWRRFILVLILAQVLLLVPFAAFFTDFIERSQPGRRAWARISLIGLVIAVVVGSVADLFWGVLSLGAVETFTDEMLGTWLTAYDWAVFALFQPALALWGIAAGVAILTSGALPRWQGWFALAVAIPHLASTLWIVDGTFTGFHDAAGAIGLIGHFGIWVPAVAVSMVRHRTARR